MLVVRNVINAVLDKARNLDRCETLKRRVKKTKRKIGASYKFQSKISNVKQKVSFIYLHAHIVTNNVLAKPAEN